MSEQQPMGVESEHLPGIPGPGCNDEQWVTGRTCNRWGVAMLLALALALVGGGLAFLLWEPVYEVTAVFQYDERPPYLAFDISKDDGRSNKFLQTQIELIRHWVVLNPVLKRPEIAKVPEIAREVDKVAYLAKQIKVAPVGDSTLFTIAYASPDPKNAEAVVAAVTESYFTLWDQTGSEQHGRTIELLYHEMHEHQVKLVLLREKLRTLATQAASEDPFADRVETTSPQKNPLADMERRLSDAWVEGIVLDARIKAAEEELAARRKEGGAPADHDGKLSKQEIVLRDAMAERDIEENVEVRRLKKAITTKRSDLKAAEQLPATEKKTSVIERLTANIRHDEQTLDGIRGEMKSRAQRQAELGMLARRVEMETSHIQRRMEELDRMRSDLATCRLMQKMLKEMSKEWYDKQRKDVGKTLDLEVRRDELAREEKVFDLIATRALQLQTERRAPDRVTLVQPAETPATPVESFPCRSVLWASLAGFSLPFLGLLAFTAMSWVVSAGFPVVKRRLPQTPASDSRK